MHAKMREEGKEELKEETVKSKKTVQIAGVAPEEEESPDEAAEEDEDNFFDGESSEGDDDDKNLKGAA